MIQKHSRIRRFQLRNLVVLGSIFTSLGLMAPHISLASVPSGQRLSLGQGIASPANTNFVNYRGGWTAQNPVGAVVQENWRVTGQFSSNGNNVFGGELGYGDGSFGLAGGYRQADCDNCDGQAALAAAFTPAASVGLGFRFMEDLYGIGLLFNTGQGWRFGITGELDDGGPSSSDRVARLGAGLGYMAGAWSFVLDASHRLVHSSQSSDDRILLTPGLSLRADFLEVSLNYKVVVNDNSSSGSSTDGFWFGLGLSGASYHVGLYMDYEQELAANLSFYF